MALTTIDIDDLHELRLYLFSTNRTMRSFVNEAIKQKWDIEKRIRETAPYDLTKQNFRRD